MAERGQGTVEWVGLLSVVACCRAVRGGVRVPGAALARAMASRILCAAALADGCGDEPELIAAYGTRSAGWFATHADACLRAGLAGGAGRLPPLPQRRLRRRGGRRAWSTAPTPACRSTAFVHVVDCRPEAAGVRGRGRRLLGRARRQPLHPVLDLLRRLRHAARRADRRRARAITTTTGRASSSASAPTARSTSAPPPTTATTTAGSRQLGLRRGHRPAQRRSPRRSAPAPHNGWGPETAPALRLRRQPRRQRRRHPPHRPPHPGRRVHLIPLEPIAAGEQDAPLRDQPAVAQARLARPRGRGDRLTARCIAPWRHAPSALLRRHPQGAVEADRLAVQHRVGDDLGDQLRVLLGPAEARGEGDAGAERRRAPPRAAPPAAACRRGRGRSSPRGPRARPCRAPRAGSCRRCRPSRPRRRPGRSGRRRRRSRRC